MTTKLRELIPYGYKTFTGHILPDHAVDAYNQIQTDINRWIIEGRKVPEHLLNESFECFNNYATDYGHCNQ